MATNRTALSANFVDVNNAINGGGPFVGPAADGSIVTIPAGPAATWTQGLLINGIAITLQGQGIGNTIIKDGVTGPPCLKVIAKPGSVGSPATSFTTRITGIEFQEGGRKVESGGSPVGPPSGGGVINFSALDNRYDGRIRWDNCKTTDLNGSVVFDTVLGLVDHNEFNWQKGSWCKIWHPNWNGGRYADRSQADPINWGTEDFLYLELNAFTAAGYIGATDSYCGGRSCWRNNELVECCITSHGTETGGGRSRGLAAFEVYQNHSSGTVSPSNARPMGSLRSGVHTIWGNRNANNLTATGIPLRVYRPYLEFTNSGFGSADGRNDFDSNAPGGPFASGVASSGTSGATYTMTVSPSPGWSPNHWRGYSVIKKTGLISGQVNFSLITDNNGDTITYLANFAPTKTPTFLVGGESFEFWKINHCLDQPGRHGGAIIPTVNPAQLPDGSNPSGDPTADWRNNGQDQVSDPCYEWDNHRDDGSHTLNFDSGAHYTIRPVVTPGDGGHYYTDHRQRPGYMPLGAHSLAGPTTPAITSLDNTSVPQGVGGTFQCSDTGFSSSPTYSKTTTNPGESFPASGTTFNGSGLLTVGVGSAAGTYKFTIHAVNGGQNDVQAFTLTITAAPTKIIGITGSLAFGDVDISTTAQLNFTIANTGDTVLTVTNITLPTGFTADWTAGTIGPGASHLVVVTFAPVAGISYSGTVTVVSDKTSGTNTLAASGTGVTRVIGLSGSLAFGSITTGQTATRQLTINNSGNRALVVSSISFPEGFNGDLTGATIAAGGSKIVNVTFSPLAVQAYSGNVSIVSNATSGTSSVAASGTGTAAATKIIQLTGSLDFGDVQTSTTPTKVLRITNSGNTDLTVTSITYPTGFSGSFSGVIAAGAFHDVTVTFSPVAAISYSGTVTVASDATGGANTTTASGVGVVTATRIIALSGNLAFGNATVGTSPTRSMVITNNGNAPLAVSSISLPTGFSGSFSGTLAPGASATVTITFSPTAAQVYSGNVTVNSDATSGTGTIGASGSGVPAATRVISITGDLAFGSVQKNHSVQKVMVITNLGSDTLAVTNITCPTAFSVDLTSCSIAPGTTQNVTVTFRPTAQQSYGGLITVVSNKTSGANTIPCSGGGTNKKQVPFFLIVG